MEIEDRSRPRSTLPPIGALSMDRRLEDEPRQHPKYPFMPEHGQPTPRLPSPSAAVQPGPPASYSYASSTASSGHGVNGYISPPDSRRTTKDDGDQSAARQSLPSIHEALSHNPLYATPTQPGPPEQPPQPPGQAPSVPPPPPRSFLGRPQGPPNPFATASGPTPGREPSISHAPSTSFSQSHPSPESQRSGGFVAVNGNEARPAPIQTYGLPRSPRTATSSSFAGASNRSPPMGNGYGPSSATSPTSYGSFKSPFPPNQQSHPSSMLGPADESKRPFAPDWSFNNGQKFAPPPPIGPGPSHTESVKRHLDIYESEMAMNEILEGSGQILDFSKAFAQKMHQNQRSEFPLDSLPSLLDVDDMIRQAHRLHAGLDRIRNSVIFQQQALADERNKAYHHKMYEAEMNGYHDDMKGGFSVGDAKKRRGKAAPPGRCHSCNRAETPEWRRGPDGARTLCNACGLHYAKLTRKNGATKGSQLGGSNLRPKNEM